MYEEMDVVSYRQNRMSRTWISEMGLLIGMNAVCNGYVNQWRLYICLSCGDSKVKGLVFSFFLDRV